MEADAIVAYRTGRGDTWSVHETQRAASGGRFWGSVSLDFCSAQQSRTTCENGVRGVQATTYDSTDAQGPLRIVRPVRHLVVDNRRQREAVDHDPSGRPRRATRSQFHGLDRARHDTAQPLPPILLVPRAELPDPNFKDSIVLVMNHIGPSPAGVIINRPTRIPVARVFPELESQIGRA